MSQKKLIEAIGDIENEFLEEYSSYVPKKNVRVYTVMKVMAACLALVLCGGGIWLWVGTNGSPQENSQMVAKKEHNHPQEKEQMPESSLMPQVTIAPEQTVITEPPMIAEVTTQKPEDGTSQEVIENEAVSYEKTGTENQKNNTIHTDGIYADASENHSMVTEPVPTPMVTEEQLNHSTVEEENNHNENNQTESEENTAKPVETQQPKPFDEDNTVTASNWNQVKCKATPCDPEMRELDLWCKELQNYVQNNSSSVKELPKNHAVINYQPNVYTAGMSTTIKGGVTWNAKNLGRSPVMKGWYWFDTDALQWDKEYVLQREKEKNNAMSNVLLIKGEARLYIMQNPIIEKTLKEANAAYPEKAFKDGLKSINQNGIEMYLVENNNGELYVRFLIDGTLVTIVDQGFGKDVLDEMLKSVKITF